jgi:NADP-dependent 3-hydroxy acid dehydrogenase YdfG/tetratricopeptide (TPR) repeat protein
MADSKEIAIAYCDQNESIAETIVNELGHAHYTLIRYRCSDQTNLATALKSFSGKVVLLLTDNLLKSKNCLDGLLIKVSNLLQEGLLIPVVAPGSRAKVDGSGMEVVETTFDKVGQVIKYMNYWQDRYFETRQKARSLGNSETEVEKIRVISGEIGEMLSLLRNQKCHSYKSFRENAYELFFDIVNDNAGHKELKSILEASNQISTFPDNERSLVELIEDSSEALISENKGIGEQHFHPLDEKVFLEEFSEEELASIPGMEVLSARPQTASKKTEEVAKQEELQETKKQASKMESQPSEIGNTYLDDLPELRHTPLHAVDELLDELMYEESEDEQVDLVFESEQPEEEEIASILQNDDDTKQSEKDNISHSNILKKLAPVTSEPTGGKRFPSAGEALEVGIKLFEAGLNEQAIGFLQGAVEGRPDDITLRYYYAYALARYAREFILASEQLNILLKLDPQHSDAWFLLAELSEIQQDFVGAERCFLKVAGLQADYPDLFYRLGLVYALHMDNTAQKAADCFELAVKQDPKNIDALYHLAVLQSEKLDDPLNALQNLNKVLEINPDHPFANYDLALLHYRFDDKVMAYDYYIKAVEINPELQTETNEAVFSLQTENSDHEEEPDYLMGELFEENELARTEPGEVFTSGDMETSNEFMVDQKVQSSGNGKYEPPTVLITGATSGIGMATAKIFAKNGYRVIITGRRQEKLEALKIQLQRDFKANIHFLPFDVRDIDAVHQAIDSLTEEWKNIDILINNAGLSRGLDPIFEGNIEHWDTMIDTNIKGLLYLTRAITPNMVQRKSGHIINIASSAGKEVYPKGNVYCATKFAVDALTKSMRLDLYQHNIRVSQVAPGHVEETEFAKVRFDGNSDLAAKVYEGFRPLNSGDVAEVIYFIASRPAHVNIQDVLMFGNQQASNNHIDRSGRKS